ncbi:MAG: allophanate hydrolase [Neomegalonema sp.]|nr:allophanate hydrolase [Neomegalonema sp.]
MSSDFAELSFDIDTLHAEYAKGARPADIIAEAYRRLIAVSDPGVFIHLRLEADVLIDAEALPPFDPTTKPLWGVPFAIKDNIDLADAPTTAACPAYAYDAKADAFVLAKLKEAGALLIGKTNLDQFATGLVGVRSPYGPPKNAVDPAIVPGGSSSGSAVAVGHGFVSFALGTDTAGSGRVPAGLNNIVGLKPTLGALSARGVVPACRTLDTISIFSLTVRDAYRAFEAACAFDAADAYSRKIAAPPLSAPPPNLVIGAPNAATREFYGDDAQAESFDASLAALQADGAQIVELDFSPLLDVAHMLYQGVWVAERMSVIEELFEKAPDAVLPVTREVIGKATSFSATDAFRDFYRLAELRRQAEPLLAQVDLLCVPTMPCFVSLADIEAEPIAANSRLGLYTNFVNLLDMCGTATPTAPRSDGRPGGVTLLAPAGRDALAAAVAERLQQRTAPTMGATGRPLPAAPARSAGPTEDEIALVAVGAHMSGLPLNSELTSRGGRFLAATETAAEYRLYALPGGPPARPGLLRTAEGGAPIAVETWALPRAAFGDFIAGIPAPLSIGALKLADGSLVKGFLVEHAGLEGAEDVTRFGGWRAYLQSKG